MKWHSRSSHICQLFCVKLHISTFYFPSSPLEKAHNRVSLCPFYLLFYPLSPLLKLSPNQLIQISYWVSVKEEQLKGAPFIFLTASSAVMSDFALFLHSQPRHYSQTGCHSEYLNLCLCMMLSFSVSCQRLNLTHHRGEILVFFITAVKTETLHVSFSDSILSQQQHVSICCWKWWSCINMQRAASTETAESIFAKLEQLRYFNTQHPEEE